MNTDPFPTNGSLPLKTLGPNGKPPKQRLSNAAHAQSLYWTLREAALPRLDKARTIQGLFDGNPPYNQAKRRDRGSASQPNFNTLDGISRLDAGKVPYYDLLSSAASYADCQTDETSDEVDAATASRVRSQGFNTLLKSYSSFDVNFWTQIGDFVGFNKGFMWFPRPDSWHFKRIPWHKVLFPDGASTDPDEWEMFAITHSWPVHKLFGFVKDESAAKSAGWNVLQVWKAIQMAAPDDVGRSYRDPMELQKAMRDSDLFMSARIGTVQAASVYTREFDGKWSRMMIQTQMGNQRRASSAVPESQVNRSESRSATLGDENKVGEKDWLYNKANCADTLHEILCPFIFEAGDGSINEINGLGKKIFAISQATDRLANMMVHSASMQSSIVMQPVTGAAQAKTSIIQFGDGVMVAPAGYTIQNGSIFGNLEAPLAISTDLRNRLDSNTGIYRPSFEKPRGNPESATGANLRFSQATVLTNSAVNRYYSQLDHFYAEVFRRASRKLPASSSDSGIKSAIEFQKYCEDRGLSDKQIRDLKPGYIRAVRAVGNGSPMMRQQMLAGLGQIVPYMGPRGLQAWKIDYAAAFAGQNGAERYFPKEDTAQVPSRDDWDASQENADLNQGNQVVFADWQDHEVHAKSHLTAAVGAVSSVLKGGADPTTPALFLQMAMPHAGQHISKVPREQVRKSLEEAYKTIAVGAKEVMAAAEKKIKQGQQQNALTFEQNLELQQATHKAKVAETSSRARNQLKMERQQFDMTLKKQQSDQDAALKDSTTAADISRQTATTVSQIEQQRAKTLSDIETQRAKKNQKDSND